jgi:cell fate (sporulation/competence/biofilm development) regulator YlbF (YheA/YmcA/DUF963 family)
MTDIIIQAYRAIDEIADDPRLIELKELNKAIETTHHREVEAFKRAKDTFERIENEGGAYHPDYKAASRMLSEAKQALYRIDAVKRYVELERQMNAELQAFLERIVGSISQEIKTLDNPWIKSKGGTCNAR